VVGGRGPGVRGHAGVQNEWESIVLELDLKISSVLQINRSKSKGGRMQWEEEWQKKKRGGRCTANLRIELHRYKMG